MAEYESVIVGGGPAGLSAGLILARARRRVLIIDANRPRNAATFMAHGYLTRDGIPPQELRRLGRDEILQYPTTEFGWGEVKSVSGQEGDFRLQIAGVRGAPDREVSTETIVLATGLVETLPQVPNIRGFYGISLFSCVHCDGWERREQSLVVIGENPSVLTTAKTAFQWAEKLTVLTNGSGAIDAADTAMLAAHDIVVHDSPITELVGEKGFLERVDLADGTTVEALGGFVLPTWSLPPIVNDLVATAADLGGVKTDEYGRSTVPGIYAAGDIRGIVPSQLIISAGDGARAGVGVNRDLSNAIFR